MYRFSGFLTEAIQHLDHAADLSFDGKEGAHKAIKTIKAAASGKDTMTRKLDDKLSFTTIVHKDGKVGVKYKGPGSQYMYSHADIDKQYGPKSPKHKPYIAEPMKHLINHLYKVLPHREGEYQGGLMSTEAQREISKHKIAHTPNTLTYAADKNSDEGKKLAKSKISVALHTEITGGQHKPLNQSELQDHPDVHIHKHEASDRGIHVDDMEKIHPHIAEAEKLARKHTYDHHIGHEAHMRSYIHSLADSEKEQEPTTEGYKKFLRDHYKKQIDKLSLQRAKTGKTEIMKEKLRHVNKHKEHFDRSFKMHHHLQQAVNNTVRSLDRHGQGGFTTQIGGQKSGGEGYVMNGVKLVDRRGFTVANRKRSAELRAKK